MLGGQWLVAAVVLPIAAAFAAAALLWLRGWYERARSPRPQPGAPMRRVAVLVLGDLGRSPRMQYHCLSLARLGCAVDLIGFDGERCVPELESSPHVHKVFLAPPPVRSRRCFALTAIVKVLQQLATIAWALLFTVPRPDAVLLQVPPSMPTLLVLCLVKPFRGFRVVVDWHNFGHTILAMSAGPRHPYVRVLHVYEKILGRLCGDRHLCVTDAMRVFLQRDWCVSASVMHDHPPSFFRRQSALEAHELWGRLGAAFDDDHARLGLPPPARGPLTTLFTECPPGGTPRLRSDRPCLLISSTSWTPDEDFGPLLEALVGYAARRAAGASRLPPLAVVITGKGPLRAGYERQIEGLRAEGRLDGVAVRTMWLEPADYPRILGCADLGVCLHTSSSGLDLPMKVVDMFGSGLPVCARAYGCLGELVRDGANGRVFGDAAELEQQLVDLLSGFPDDCSELRRLAQGAATSLGGWQPEWDRNAKQHFVQ